MPFPAPPSVTPTALPRIKPKLGKNVVLFSLTVACLFLVVLAAILFVIAKSGMARVPLFSLLYHAPMPTRVVEGTRLSAQQFEEQLSVHLIAQIAERKPPPYRFTMTEQQLTGLLQSSLGGALRDKAWSVRAAQLVIRPATLELFGEFVRGIWRADILVRFIPQVHNGTVSFTAISIQIGEYTLPASVAAPILGLVFERDLGSWSIAFGSARLQDIRLAEGTMEIRLSPRSP